MVSAISMNRRFIRRLALALIALLAFAQVGVALAGCFMDRGGMASMATLGDCCSPAPEFQPAPQFKNDCLAHCTADLQLSGLPVGLVQAPADTPVLLLPHPGLTYPAAPPPAPPIPSRILLHSFLI
jgi:hypothetical protein